jgi:hypothetical protein
VRGSNWDWTELVLFFSSMTAGSNWTPATSTGRSSGAGNMSGRPRELEFSIEPGQVLRVLVGGIVLVVTAGIVVSVADVGFGRGTLYGLGPLFDLDREATIPAMFSCSMLLFAACLLGILARESARHGHRWRRHWTILALGFVFLALDEGAGIHEHMNRPIRELLHAPGFATAWLVPAMVPVIVLAVYYLPFLRVLPRRHAGLFLGSGLLFLFGAVALEAVAGEIIERFGKANFAYQAEVWAEESCEMLGAAVFIYALLDYLAELGLAVRFHAARRNRGSVPSAQP